MEKVDCTWVALAFVKAVFPIKRWGVILVLVQEGTPNSFSYLMLSVVIAWTPRTLLQFGLKVSVSCVCVGVYISQSILYFVVDIHTLYPAN